MDELSLYAGQLEGTIDPRQHDHLIGHEEQRQAITNAFEKDRFPQAWLLQGPSGVGKATFAWHFARRLVEAGKVSEAELPREIVEKYARGSQSKILDISFTMDDKGKFKSQISVDQIRSLSEKLSLSSDLDEWRVVIIDPADAMNNAAANALLKLLEEPPQRVVFFLITDAPHRLLPTIHSRCQKIRFHELSIDELTTIWPLVSEVEMASAERLVLSEGSMRMAFAMDDEMSRNYEHMVSTLNHGVLEKDITSFSRAVLRGNRAEDLSRAKLLFHIFFGRLARIAANISTGNETEQKAANRIEMRLPRWAELSQRVMQNLDDAMRLNLDAEVTIVTQWLTIQDSIEKFMTPPLITDSHCHLDFPQFEGELDDIIQRSKDAGVWRLVSISTTSKGLPGVKNIAAQYSDVYYAFGIHPLHVHEEPIISKERLIAECQAPKMVGLGETGLDYHYSKDTEAMQKDSLHFHISAAQETGLPLIIHSRAADEDMAEILSSRFNEAPYSCVMHCFSSGRKLAETALECGFYLSMSGVTTFKNSNDLRDIFRDVPLDRILVETDSPYLAPVPHRGKRNEPAYCAETARMAASLFDLSYEDFAKQTEENFERLFPKVKL